jgi:hypothetical protein
MKATTLAESEPIQSTQQRWSALSLGAFRFCFVYFGLFCFSTQIINCVLAVPKIEVPDPATLPPFRPAIMWVGAHVFRLTTPLVFSGSGSGDKYFDWVLQFCILITALIATLVWSVLDRKRRNYATLQKWFWLFLRFCLGGQMLVYGSLKAFPLQMPYPYLFTLVEPFGNLSPMGVLWGSIGASPAYETFAGCAELLGGVLLMFPRTVTLGALICLADMTQVFMLNMTYDVPVKLLSFHLILISLLILQPDFKRLASVFLLNRPAEAPQRTPLFATRRAQRIASGTIAFLWVWMIACDSYGVWDGWHTYGPRAQKSPLYGIWNLEGLTLDGKPHALSVTEAQQWRRLIFDFPEAAQIQLMDDSRTGYNATVDLRANTLTLNDRKNKDWKATFSFTRPAPDRLVLDGTMNGQKATLQLTRLDHTKFLLVSRGFHWIQDYPFNR